jgi:hypothetical protein
MLGGGLVPTATVRIHGVDFDATPVPDAYLQMTGPGGCPANECVLLGVLLRVVYDRARDVSGYTGCHEVSLTELSERIGRSQKSLLNDFAGVAAMRLLNCERLRGRIRFQFVFENWQALADTVTRTRLHRAGS